MSENRPKILALERKKWRKFSFIGDINCALMGLFGPDGSQLSYSPNAVLKGAWLTCKKR